MYKASLLFLFFLACTNQAFAACTNSWVCDDYGMDCQTMQVCDSTLDLPDVGLPPLRPLPSTDLKPLPSIELPPLGTTNCEHVQVNGRWQNICY